MAKFTVEETIYEGAGAKQIWARLRKYLAKGKTVELVRRTSSGEIEIEVRRWNGVRSDGSNRASATADTDY